MDYVKNDVHFQPACTAVLCHMARSRQRFNPTIPDWLLDRLTSEKQALGPGDRTHGGAQRVAMAALLLYFTLPEPDRRNLARLMSNREEESVRRDLNAHWIGRAMKALNELGETSVPTLEGAVQAVRARRQEAGRSDTPGTAAASREAADHRSRRRRGA